MSVNSSNSSLHPHPHPSSLSLFNILLKCYRSTAGSFTITAFTITSILFILPLCILVLYLGHQRWRQQHSGAVISHSDLFTYHMVITELMNILGFTLTCCGVLTDIPEMMMPGLYLSYINISAQMFFHILTCVERYLAVVHPVTYLGLRKARGIRIRNITIGCVWLLCFAATGLMFIEDTMYNTIIAFCIAALSLIIICFCSLSVLCVLSHPGPGEGGGSRQQVHQSKLRAFYTIMAILGVLLLRFGHSILATVLFTSLEETGMCAIWFSTPWFSLPSSLVLPVLFLHRAGKLPCCKNTESGQGSQ
ncbi:uncharacterized protein LOC121889385 [Thunnus maccoyii]|uniref:uncharacterized protein LOC121889385 n=1 Tax=Thunnus maccoyii TaxID=8240 RepID=UPI001C4ABF20|nr:uncharacterized protein LOC121889385 [Thunnus maccoyii]